MGDSGGGEGRRRFVSINCRVLAWNQQDEFLAEVSVWAELSRKRKLTLFGDSG
jgi:hypothetical protein